MEVCIIGGSIAGLEAALQLADFCEVTVFEEHSKIGEPVKCAEGWTSFMGIEPYVDGVRIHRAEVHVLDDGFNTKRSFTIKTDGNVVMISRPEMEGKMAKMAEEMGVRIITSRRVKISEATESYDLIVDASGYPSQWCREFGGKPRGAAAVEAFTDYETDELYFGLYPRIDGYFWIFPRFAGGSNVGVGYFRRRPNVPLRKLLDDFMRKMGIEARGYTGGLLGCTPNRPFVRWFASKPVALIGDAAGLVDTFMGEGMTKAVISARILARCVRERRIEDYEMEYFRLMRKYYTLFNFLYLLRTRFMNVASFVGKLGVFTQLLRLLTRVARRDMKRLRTHFESSALAFHSHEKDLNP